MKEWGLRFLISAGLLLSGCSVPAPVFPRPVPGRVALWGSSTSETLGALVNRPSFQKKIAQRLPQIKEIFSGGQGGGMLHDLTPMPLGIYLAYLPDLRVVTAGRNDLLAGELPAQLADEIGKDWPGDFWAFPFPVNQPGMAQADESLREEIAKRPGLSEKVLDVGQCYSSDFNYLGSDGLHLKDEQAYADWVITIVYLYSYGSCFPAR